MPQTLRKHRVTVRRNRTFSVLIMRESGLGQTSIVAQSRIGSFDRTRMEISVYIKESITESHPMEGGEETTRPLSFPLHFYF